MQNRSNVEQESVASAFTNAEMKANLLQLTSQLYQLKAELKHAKSTIVELENQNLEYERMLSGALSQLQIYKPKSTAVIAPKRSWIGTWECSSDDPQLAPIENAWANGWLQKALSQMPAVLARQDLGPHHAIKSRLLYSSLLQCTGVHMAKALAHAEEAATMAIDRSLQDLAAKAQLQRGLCYHHLGEFANARWCFVLASSTDRFIRDCRQMNERSLEDLPDGHSQRCVSPDFRFYCNAQVDRFVCGELQTEVKRIALGLGESG